MLHDAEFHYDMSLASAIGRRDLQEDAVEGHFPAGQGLGYVVLADGMGGHAAGDVASRIVVQEFSAELARYAYDPDLLERNVGVILRRAMSRANRKVASHAFSQPARRGMGATLVAPLIVRNRLYWISVGDSPLYLLRGDRMSRLNQEHSVAQRLDRMVMSGLISQVEADRNPDRFCLTSVLVGVDVPEIDCRDRPIELQDGDILIVASDGILSINEHRIAKQVFDSRALPSTEINTRLLQDIDAANDPYQDNVSLCVVKIRARMDALKTSPAATPSALAERNVNANQTVIQVHLRRGGTREIRSFSSSITRG